MYQAQLSRHIDTTQELPAIIPVPRRPFVSSWYLFHIHKVAGARDMSSWAPIVILFHMCPVDMSSFTVLSLSLDKSLVVIYIYISKKLPGGSRVKTSPSRRCLVDMWLLPCCSSLLSCSCWPVVVDQYYFIMVGRSGKSCCVTCYIVSLITVLTAEVLVMLQSTQEGGGTEMPNIGGPVGPQKKNCDLAQTGTIFRQEGSESMSVNSTVVQNVLWSSR